MTVKILSLSKIITPLALITSLFLSVVAIHAQAVFIDFDDLTYVPQYNEMPHFADTPLSDQYLSQGLLISDGFLLPYNMFDPEAPLGPEAISGPNYLLGANTLDLYFVGENLPTFVGMYVGSGNGETIFLEAYDVSGLLFSAYTAGDGGPAYSAPYTHKQYVSFESKAGIERIQMWGFYGSRVSAMVDDLTFTYADVPEPFSLLLLCAGIFAFIYKRINLLYSATRKKCK